MLVGTDFFQVVNKNKNQDKEKNIGTFELVMKGIVFLMNMKQMVLH